MPAGSKNAPEARARDKIDRLLVLPRLVADPRSTSL